jgi:hypothetical protein
MPEPTPPSWYKKPQEGGYDPLAYLRAMSQSTVAGQAMTGQLGPQSVAGMGVPGYLGAARAMTPAMLEFVRQTGFKPGDVPGAYREVSGMMTPAAPGRTPEYQEDLAQKRRANISVGVRPDQGPIYETYPDWREAMRKTRPAELKRRGAGGADATQAALKAGLEGSARVLRKGKKKPTKTKGKDHAMAMDTATLQKSAAAGSNYDGTLLSIVISARRQAAQNELAFVPVYDYKNSRVVLVRADGVDMVYNMKDRRHRDALRSGLLKAKHDPTEVMQMADRISAPLKRSIAKDINTEEDVIKALSWM